MKYKSTTNHRKQILTGSAIVLAATASVFAQQKPFMQAGTSQPPVPPIPAKVAAASTNAPAMTGTNALAIASTNAPATTSVTDQFSKLLDGKIPDTIAKGKVNVNVRLRYEQADQNNLANDSYAPTIRTRVGYTSAPLYGFQAMVEGVNVAVIGPEHNYNAAGSNGQGTRPVVADPPMTELSQAWIGYSYEKWIATKVGQQPINLDNQRFVGDVAWRQNMQTFDAVSVGSEPIENLKLYYSYLWEVNRVFGNVSGLPAGLQDFDSNSHLINLAYSGWKYGRFVGYSYLLDLSNAAGNNNSCATYGGYFAGQADVTEQVTVDYRAEYAWQNEYGDSTLDYGANYYNFEVGASLKPFALGAGYEMLGSGKNTGAGGGRTGFKTPLATLHAFNGWDDVFLNTPANGLQDIYGYAQVTVPTVQIPVRFVFHKFDADHGSGDYGQEYDVVASKKLGKHWSALVKYAYYDGQDAPAAFNVQKFWAQVEFNF